MSEEDVKNHHKMVEELKKREQKTDNLQVTLYNWGPCVVKFKIKDNFQKMLEAEAKLAE